MSYHIRKTIESCGCEYQVSETTLKGSKATHGVVVMDIIGSEKLIKECFVHQKQRLGIEKVKEELKIFPSDDAKNIYKLLDKMIDDLEESGVDVSYFPDRAKLIMKKYAIKISKQYNGQT